MSQIGIRNLAATVTTSTSYKVWDAALSLWHSNVSSVKAATKTSYIASPIPHRRGCTRRPDCSRTHIQNHKEELKLEIQNSRQVVYAGVDPTATSLHVGHLLPLLCLLHFHIRGHQIIPLIGGATGLIGDPSGRSTERPLSEESVVEHNVHSLTTAIQRFFSRATEYARDRLQPSQTPLLQPDVRNNLEWTKDMGLLEFLRKIGIHSRINSMMGRESVRARLESQQGISFTEFTYQLLQSYDFLNLHETAGCNIQIGGSDQWGNIVAGIDLINRVNAASNSGGRNAKGFGIVTPLLTTATGEKFGKSAGNAVSLDETITNVFDFYQFFLRTPDADATRYLKMFTLLPMSRIDETFHMSKQRPEKRIAQRLLASEVTELVHGRDAVQRAEIATAILFDNDCKTIRAEEAVKALRGLPVFHAWDKADLFGIPLAKMATRLQITSSNSAARQLISAKGLYLNNQPVTDPNQTLSIRDLIDGRIVVLRVGKYKQAVVALSTHGVCTHGI
ncbi:uncharacterized protein FIBRA_03164 [Fibroporia radiculosa]|uniref:Tyrosine--tRNA ligase n=1 Tax=Fibroporia radiculosa TaxID=599839 RepID=J4I9G4_9APHY|nr:uncharacterized protein FIBRA_03164 [Fibroporia radiculosa]CCM01116.1 predicted protein [Fibroporia radiculosa]